MNTPIFEENTSDKFKGIDIMRAVRSFDPVPAVRRAHVPRQGKGAAQDALADPGPPILRSSSDRRLLLGRGTVPATPPPQPPGSRRPHRAPARRAARACADPKPHALAEELHPPGHRSLRRRVSHACSSWPTSSHRAWSTDCRPTSSSAASWWCTACTPTTLESRVERALAAVRPVLAAHKGDVELLDIDPDGERGEAAAARQLRRMPVLGRHAPDGGREGDPRSRARDRDHRRRGALSRRGDDPCDAHEEAGLRAVPSRGRRMTGDPLGVLRRVRESPLTTPKPQPGERCELCGEPISDGAQPPRRPRRRARSCARAAAATCSSRPDGAGGGHFKAVPDRYLAFTEVHLTPSQWDALQIPVSRRVLLRELHDRSRRRVLPEPGRRDRVVALARRVGRARRCEPRARDAAARRRGVPRPHRSSDEGRSRSTSCRSTRATSSSATSVGSGKASTAVQRLTRRSSCSSSGCETGRGRDRVRVHVRRRSTRAPSRTPAVPTIMLRTRISEHTGATVHALASAVPDPDRAAAAPVRGRGREPPRRALRRAATVGATRCDRSSGRTWRRPSPTFTGATEIDLPITCTYDFEIAVDEVPPRARRRRDSRSCCSSPAPRSYAETRGCSVAPVAWHADTTFRLPVAVWRQTMDVYFPNSGWVMLSRDVLDKLTEYKASRALASWDLTVEHLLKEAQ